MVLNVSFLFDTEFFYQCAIISRPWFGAIHHRARVFRRRTLGRWTVHEKIG